MALKEFKDVGKQLKFYVYLLVHPDTHKIFYVGKGEYDRVFDHVKDVRKKIDQDSPLSSAKERIIADILRSGKDKEPLMYIVRYNLEENEAFLLESTLIEFLNKGLFNLPQQVSGSVEFEPLSNIQGGHSLDKGSISTVEELYLRKGSEELKCEDSERGYQKGHAIISEDKSINLLVAKLSSHIGEIQDPVQKMDRTRGDWPLSKPIIDELLKEGLYIASAEDRIITDVYKIDGVDQWLNDRVRFKVTLLKSTDPISQEIIGKNVYFNNSRFPIIYCC